MTAGDRVACHPAVLRYTMVSWRRTVWVTLHDGWTFADGGTTYEREFITARAALVALDGATHSGNAGARQMARRTFTTTSTALSALGMTLRRDGEGGYVVNFARAKAGGRTAYHAGDLDDAHATALAMAAEGDRGFRRVRRRYPLPRPVAVLTIRAARRIAAREGAGALVLAADVAEANSRHGWPGSPGGWSTDPATGKVCALRLFRGWMQEAAATARADDASHAAFARDAYGED